MYATGGASFFEDVPLVDGVYVPGVTAPCITLYLLVCQVRITVGDSGLCCFVPRLSSAVNLFCLLLHFQTTGPESAE